jgi:hypothetical protein
MINKTNNVFDFVEPSAFAMSNFSPEQCALFSIAVSMKRIADFMGDSDKYGCTGSAAISNAIRDGMREGR